MEQNKKNNKTAYIPAATPVSAGQTAKRMSPEPVSERPLLKNNFILMGISLLLIILGFCLMAGSSSDVDAFNPDIFSTRRIVVGPTISFLGFVCMGIAIIIKPKK